MMNTEKQERIFQLDHQFQYNETFKNNKLRLTYSDSTWTLKLDLNTGTQSEYSLDYTAINTGKSQLTLSSMGSIRKTIEDENLGQSYDFAVFYLRRVGIVPLVGELTVKFYQFVSFVNGQVTEQKFRIGFFVRNIDWAFQLMREREKGWHSHYYLSYHDETFNVTLGKTVNHKVTGVLILKKSPLWNVSLWDYFTDSRKWTGVSYSALKNGDSGFYHQFQSELGAWLVLLGDKGVNLPIFPSFLPFGDFSHYLEMTCSPTEFRLENQLGLRIKNRFGFGAGVYLKRIEPEKLKISPIVSAYLKIPVSGWTFLLEGKYRDRIILFYAFFQVQF